MDQIQTETRDRDDIKSEKGNNRPLNILMCHPSSLSQHPNMQHGHWQRHLKREVLMSPNEMLTFRWRRGGADMGGEGGRACKVKPRIDFMTSF